jgi:uroporphyrinogen decarboxylase
MTALNREPPDRPPLHASFTPEFAARLRRALGMATDTAHDPHNGRWNGYDLELATHLDALQCSIGWVTNYYLDSRPYVDEWGVAWKIDPYDTPFGRGIYTNLERGPLEDDRAIPGYHPPDPTRPALYDHLARLIREHQAHYYIIGRLHTTIFETAWALRGLTTLMMDLLLEPERADAVLDIPYQYHRVVAQNMARMGVDMIWLGDDVGAQKHMLIAPGTWRKFLKHRMAAIIAETKAIQPDLKIAYHCDGNMYPIIPDLIEIGVDVLNPIQPEALNPAQVKRDFGDRLSFFGGIDVQTTLPFGTPEQVRQAVRDRMDTLGKGGGWICAPTHHVQLDTPLENFWAMVDAVMSASYARA